MGVTKGSKGGEQSDFIYVSKSLFGCDVKKSLYRAERSIGGYCSIIQVIGCNQGHGGRRGGKKVGFWIHFGVVSTELDDEVGARGEKERN